MKIIQGKVIIITGASSGIGAETARTLAANGAKVVLSARREERLKTLAGEIGENNAGIMPAGNMSELKTGDWTRMVQINIMGVLNAMAAVLPEFIANRNGHIVVTSSVAGTRSVPGNAVYCGTKHFVRAMLDSFRQEAVAEGTNIRTTTIFPGAIKTELLNTVAPSETKKAVEAFYENVGLSPCAIANAVLYALSQSEEVDISELTVRPAKEG